MFLKVNPIIQKDSSLLQNTIKLIQLLANYSLLYSKGKSFVFFSHFISEWEIEWEDFHFVLQDRLSKVWKPGQKNKTLVVMDCLNFYQDVIRRVFLSNNPMQIKCNNSFLQVTNLWHFTNHFDFLLLFSLLFCFNLELN